MENRPSGRKRNVTGQGKDIYKRGDGLGKGPVGDTSGRPGSSGRQSYSQSSSGETTRASGKSSLLSIIIVVLVLLIGGGGGGLLGLFGGGDTSTSTASTGMSSGLSSILGSLGGGSVSTGWDGSSNTGALNESVASGARAKRTEILGSGNDTFTIMVYMCGTDLESKSGMATADLKEMYNATISDKVNILVYTGGCKSWQNSLISSKVNQIYKVESGGLRCLVDNDGSASMTNPSTLSGFIKWANKNYPANRMALIFWDHGGGSISGYGYDEKNSSSGSMNLKGIGQALKAGGITYDFIGFDACLMATAETGLVLADYADYMIASEETEPGVGWYYTTWLTELSKNTSMPTTTIGKNICDSFVSACNRSCPGQKTTLSVVDLAELEATLPAKLKSFASSTSALIDNKQYEVVSNARTNSREFASSSKIDQVDLVHLALNMGTDEGKQLADAVRSAVKYNVTSSSMTNAYGLSIYFPYQKLSKVNSAVQTMDAIGMDDAYTECIRKFASVETGGQAISGGASSPLSSLLGTYSSAGTTAVNFSDITSLLSGLLGGDTNGVSGLSGLASSFLGKGLDVDRDSAYLADHRFDPSALVWKNGRITLPEEQWALINDLELNVFYDDGAGYIDLGLDNVFEFDESGALIGEYDGAWIAINDQPVPYYRESTVNGVSTGYVPCFINGERAELILVLGDRFYVAGARYDYRNGETETVAKSLVELTVGDRIEFVCDYYTYDGVYSDSYLYGEEIVYDGSLTVSDVLIPDASRAVATYRFTDIYGQTYWTETF